MKRSSSRSAAVGSRWRLGKAIGSVGRMLRIIGIIRQLQLKLACFASFEGQLEPIIVLAIFEDLCQIDYTVADKVVLLVVFVQTCYIERGGILGVALIHLDVDLVVLPARSLPTSDICRGAFGHIAELEEDEGVLLAKAFSVGQVTALDRNNDQFSNWRLALVWVDKGLRQRLVDMGWRVGASSVPMEEFMHLGE